MCTHLYTIKYYLTFFEKVGYSISKAAGLYNSVMGNGNTDWLSIGIKVSAKGCVIFSIAGFLLASGIQFCSGCWVNSLCQCPAHLPFCSPLAVGWSYKIYITNRGRGNLQQMKKYCILLHCSYQPVIAFITYITCRRKP